MFAKEPVAVREDESSPQLRGHVRTQNEAAPTSEDLAASNVIALRRPETGSTEVGSEDFEARLRAAFDRTLAEPLAEAKATASAVLHQVSGPQTEQMRAMAQALANTEGGARDLLDFMVSNLPGGFRLARRRVDLKVLSERVLDAIQREHPEHLLVLQCESRVEGDWDPDRIASLLSWLVENAIEHGLPPRVTVRLRCHRDDAVLEVRNQGAPLDEALLRGLFQPFARGRPRPSGDAPGFGLGLYLSREIVHAHAGRIEATSETGATTIRVSLPRFYA
jgi:signal transduction histidine kinase